MAGNQAEDYLQFQTEDEGEKDASLVSKSHIFQGQRLFPYSPGVRLLLQDLLVGAIGGDRYLFLLMYLLIDLQVHLEKIQADAIAEKVSLHPDDADELAVERFLESVGENPRKYQAGVVIRVGKLKQVAVKEALKVAEKIYQEARQSEIVATDTSPAGEPGK